MLVRLQVNGATRETDVWEGSSLLSLLRDGLGLMGSKNACEEGECGSCSVWLDRVLVCSCLVLPAQAQGRDVRTVEGLAIDGELNPVQRAFVETGAVQCGFCTPGLVVAVTDLLGREPDASELRILDVPPVLSEVIEDPSPTFRTGRRAWENRRPSSPPPRSSRPFVPPPAAG